MCLIRPRTIDTTVHSNSIFLNCLCVLVRKSQKCKKLWSKCNFFSTKNHFKPDNIKTKHVYLLLVIVGHRNDCKSQYYFYSHYIWYAYLLLLLYLTAILHTFVISSRTIKLFFCHKHIPGIFFFILLLYLFF